MQTSNKIAIGIGFGIGLLGLFFIPKSAQASSKTEMNHVFTNIYGGNEFLSSEVRGLRNNNPANIRISKSNWKGKIPIEKNTDGSFEQFINYPYGVRALIKLIYTYYNRYNLQTVEAIITRFAPNNENNTASYILKVSKNLNVKRNQVFSLNASSLKALVLAIDQIENGKATITEAHYRDALKLL